MARKQADLNIKQTEDRAIMFRAPNQIHGALKKIVGELEMNDFRIDGRVPFERDIMIWLLGELYMEGPEKWGQRLAKASIRYKEMVQPKQ